MGDDAELLLGQFEDVLGQHVLEVPGALAGGLEGEAFRGGVVFRERRPAFHRGDDDAVVHHGQARDMGRGVEEGVGLRLVADRPVEDAVLRHLVEDQGLAEVVGGGEVGAGGQRVVVHQDGLGGVLGGTEAFRHHEGHRIADMADLAAGEQEAGGIGGAGAVAVLQAAGMGQGAEPVRRQILRRVDGEHAGHGAGIGGVDGEDRRMGVRAAQQVAGRGAGDGEVVGVAALALQQARVLDATQGLAEAELGHDSCPPTRKPVGIIGRERGGWEGGRRRRGVTIAPARALSRDERQGRGLPGGAGKAAEGL